MAKRGSERSRGRSGEWRGMRRAMSRGGLLFGTLAMMVALTVGSSLGERDRRVADTGLDMTMTGSIERSGPLGGAGSAFAVSGASACQPGLYGPARRGEC